MACRLMVFQRSFRFLFTRPRLCVIAISSVSGEFVTTLKVSLIRRVKTGGLKLFAVVADICLIFTQQIGRAVIWLSVPH